MKYAVISDVHANLQALEAVLKDAEAQGAESVVCLGDVVGYGPLPAETLRRVRSAATTVIAGNHDDAVSGRISADNFIDLAADAVKRHREALSPDELAWLKSLPYTCRLEDAVAAHGDLTDPEAFNYIETEDDAAANFETGNFQLAFVGHTHVPGVFLTGQSGTVYKIPPQNFTLEDGKRYIVNPGSVGYPREENGVCRSSYVLYDSTKRTVTFHFLPFSVSSVMQRGAVPRRRKALLAVFAVLAVFLASASAFLVRSVKAVRETVVVKVSAIDDPELVLARKSLTLTPSRQSVQANLKLERGSAPVNLLLQFKSATGDILGEQTETVKSSSAKRIKVPAGAISAHFTVLKQRPGDRPGLVSFAPTAK